MGIFGEPARVAAGQAARYWTGGVGVNFGGVCANAECPSKQEATPNVSACLGMMDGNPFMVDPRCPACNSAFQPTLMWFSNCHVVLYKMDGSTTSFDVRGNELRSVALSGAAGPPVDLDCTRFVVT